MCSLNALLTERRSDGSVMGEEWTQATFPKTSSMASCSRVVGKQDALNCGSRMHAKGTWLSAPSTPTHGNAKPRTDQPGESQSGKAQRAQGLSAFRLPHKKEPGANKNVNSHLLLNAPTAAGIATPGSDCTVTLGGAVRQTFKATNHRLPRRTDADDDYLMYIPFVCF